MAAKSLEAKVIEARAKLAALRGDERADLPSGPERTAYNKELRRAILGAKKLEAAFAAPAPSRCLVSRSDLEQKVYHPVTRRIMAGAENAKQRRREKKAAASHAPPLRSLPLRSNGQRPRKSTPRIANEHQRWALTIDLGPNSLVDDLMKAIRGS